MDDIKPIRELLIIGNGFDLQCKLKTSYKDFFSERYGINLVAETYEITDDNKKEKGFYQAKAQTTFVEIFKSAINELDLKRFLDFKGNANGYLINYFTKYLREYFEVNNFENIGENLQKKIQKIKGAKYTNWDIIFISAYILMNHKSEFQWVDIEKIIFDVVTIVLTPNEQKLTQKSFKNKKSMEKFYDIIVFCFRENKEISTSMLDSLKKFEKAFADYIRKEVHTSRIDYLKNAADLLRKISLGKCENKIELDVINFNYSLDENIAEYMWEKENLSEIKINSWTNIHGIAYWNKPLTRSRINKIHGRKNGKLASPIFGIDGHDVLSSKNDGILSLNDPRIVFTKSFRLIDNQVNSMRDENHSLQTKIDKIIFFGHSLGHADYSYFETIFDLYKIMNSDVKLNFYYHKYDTDLKNKESERRMLRKVVNLLTSYGETVPNAHGENIVNRLVLEQRLNLIPSPEN